MTAVGPLIYLKVDFGCNIKLCNKVLPALERENFHHLVAVQFVVEMGNTDKSTSPVTVRKTCLENYYAEAHR